MPDSPSTPPSGSDGAPPAVSIDLLRLFLAKKSTQDRILQVVAARMPRGTPEHLLRKVLSDVNLKVMYTTALPRSPETMRPWVSRVAVNAVFDHLREQTKQAKLHPPPPEDDHGRYGLSFAETERMAKRSEHDDAPSEDDDAPSSDDDLPFDDALEEPEQEGAPMNEDDAQVDASVLSDWLRDAVKTKADALTLEMIRFKANSGVDNARLAAEFGMTETAYNNRLLRFKAKWVPAWKKAKALRLRKLAFLGLLILLLIGIALALLYRWLSRPVAPPARAIPTAPASADAPPAPVPTSSTRAEPPFEPAAPPPSRGDGK